MYCVYLAYSLELSYKIMLYRNGIRKAEHKNENKKNIARLLSFLMVLSLLLGISAAPVYAVGGEGEPAYCIMREFFAYFRFVDLLIV